MFVVGGRKAVEERERDEVELDGLGVQADFGDSVRSSAVNASQKSEQKVANRAAPSQRG